MALFSEILPSLPVDAFCQQSIDSSLQSVDRILSNGKANSLSEFATLLSPAARDRLEQIAQISQSLTQQHFGKVIRFFAPIYLSNECVNICKYCGFSRNNPIPRKTIAVDQVVSEVKQLAKKGFKSLLIVSGEHPKFVSPTYLEDCIAECIKIMPGIQIEIGPLSNDDCVPLVNAGCEGFVLYQETYHKETYQKHHTAGPKKDYLARLEAVENAYSSGFRKLGIGALLGLYDWRHEAIALAAHAKHLTKKCWKAQVSLSFPRMRPAAGEFSDDNLTEVTDRDMIQLICAMRLYLPKAAFTLSTREPQSFRDGLIPLGITHMSAGVCTEPGGYSDFDDETWTQTREQPGEQFNIADERPPHEVAAAIQEKGYEAVWKDSEKTLVTQ